MTTYPSFIEVHRVLESSLFDAGRRLAWDDEATMAYGLALRFMLPFLRAVDWSARGPWDLTTGVAGREGLLSIGDRPGNEVPS